MPAHHPHDRTVIASIAATVKAANTIDRAELTADARTAFEQTFHDMVPPEVTDPDQRAKAAAGFKAAHFKRLALKSVQARRAKGAHNA